jgi:hypothetical protein
MENITFDTNSYLTINVKPIVKVNKTISIVGSDHELPVEITADFTNIPPHLHGIYLSAIDSRYDSGIKIWDNTGDMTPEPKTIEEGKSEWRLNRIVDIIFSKFR